MTSATEPAATSRKKTKEGKRTKAPTLPELETVKIVTRTLPVEQLIPASYNPRKVTPHALEGLKASIREFGYAEPIVWNERTGVVVGGHQRLAAMISMGVQAIEVVVVDMDPVKERALNASLNNPAIQGTWDDEKLQALLEEIKGTEEDGGLDAGFFDSVRLDELAATFDSMDFNMGGKGDASSPDGAGGDDATPPYSVQLTLTVPHADYGGFVAQIVQLQKRWGCDQTAAVMRAVAGHIE